MTTDEIRASFLEFFRERDHVIERSDLLVPGNDPTLLFTSAGMVQFKALYSGEAPVPYRRAATSQKCLRAGGKANDLDEVGKTSRHMTFFEMLGNFSFGDYFKQEAIEWAWEYITQVLKMPEERIWMSVFESDDEAYEIWEREIGIPPGRIVRMGEKDNFWGPAGDTGACGPCSELYYDRGEDIDPKATPENDPHERFIEFWNLVFPQFDQQQDGSRLPLKNRGIDTGMGLERLSALLNDKPTIFDIDIIVPIIDATQALQVNAAYDANPTPYRVIADHVRALSFLIADGVLPSNEGRGYVERRLLRRAARFGRELGLEKPFLHGLSREVVGLMGHQYPELSEKKVQIEKIIQTEEERFAGTLARGIDQLEEIFAKMKAEGDTQVPGAVLFKLHDTFGFPLDLATDIAEDRGYTVDRERFETEMEKQREKARSAWTGSGQKSLSSVYQTIRDASGETAFVGYDATEGDTTIVALIRDGAQVDEIMEGEEAEIVLHTTPFYAESGGQIGDIGVIDGVNGSAHVNDTRAPLKKLTVHHAACNAGTLKVGEKVNAKVDAGRRAAIVNHHTATHLLQAALQNVLGDHVHQAGSLVAPDRLRFDFTHFEGIDDARLLDIERLVNEYIRTDTEVTANTWALDEAREAGAMALFGEKYEEEVRVIGIDDISMELCGGIHVPRTGVIGCFKIVSEASIASGVRRIEAVCGDVAIEAVQATDTTLGNAARLLGTSPEDLEARVRSLLDENKRLGREVDKWKRAAATGGSVDYLARVQEVDGVRLLATEVEDQDAAGLRMLMDDLREKLTSGVIVLGSATDGKANLCAWVSDDLNKTIKAGDIVKQLAPIVGGGGGGRPDMAMAGGKHGDKVPEAIAKASEVVKALQN
ncbi:MAG: alanine--tRNA ligase [Candidatus Hydrogenedentes bacterium]|nr:alanine--tRNA ligase [Candidatus Hydrogenedentota bacterium]